MKTEAEKAYNRIWMRLYRKRYPERKRAATLRYNRTHREQVRAYKKRKALERSAASKIARGRVCRSCEKTDSDASWSIVLDLCQNCRKRGQENGFCGDCGQAIYLTRERGSRGGVRRCRCASPLELQVWDAIRWHRATEVTYAELATLMHCSLKTIERKREKILAVFQRWDPDASLDRSTENGTPVIFRVDLARVKRGLEEIAMREAS